MPTVVVTLKGRELQRVIIDRVTTTIGRDHRCTIAIDNPALSRHHATIHCHRGMFGVRDEGSANGIFVNGEQVQGARLADGDVLSLGKFQLEFHQAGGPAIADLLVDEPVLFDSDTNNPEQTMAISLVDLQKMVEQQGKVMPPDRPKGATYSSNLRRPGAVSSPQPRPSSQPPRASTRGSAGGGFTEDSEAESGEPTMNAQPSRRDAARRPDLQRGAASGGFAPGQARSESEWRPVSGAHALGGAHPLAGARPSTSTPARRADQSEASGTSGSNLVLMVVIAGLLGLVALLSAGLAWVVLMR